MKDYVMVLPKSGKAILFDLENLIVFDSKEVFRNSEISIIADANVIIKETNDKYTLFKVEKSQ